MNKLEKAKEIIKERIDVADCGIFSTRNWVGDEMLTVYDDGELEVDICYGYAYFDVFGLSPMQFAELEEYYNEQRKEKWKQDGLGND